jgi:hypothetical protein
VHGDEKTAMALTYGRRWINPPANIVGVGIACDFRIARMSIGQHGGPLRPTARILSMFAGTLMCRCGPTNNRQYPMIFAFFAPLAVQKQWKI